MTQKIYLRLNNDTCEFNEKTDLWRIKIPEVFTNSRNPDKKIVVNNFMYCTIADQGSLANLLQKEFITFHSPTLCDGNFNQDNYICTLCYNQNTIYKTYPIKSNPQYIEFYFNDADNNRITGFWNWGIDSNGQKYEYREKFNIDLELIC